MKITIKKDGTVINGKKEIGLATVLGKNEVGTGYAVHAFDKNKKAVVYGRDMVVDFFGLYAKK